MTYRHNRATLFRDFLSISTIALRNATEPKNEQWDAREAEYFKIIARYEKDDIFQMRDCLHILMQLAEQDYARSEEHTSELQSLMRISYAVFCLQTTNYKTSTTN